MMCFMLYNSVFYYTLYTIVFELVLNHLARSNENYICFIAIYSFLLLELQDYAL